MMIEHHWSFACFPAKSLESPNRDTGYWTLSRRFRTPPSKQPMIISDLVWLENHEFKRCRIVSRLSHRVSKSGKWWTVRHQGLLRLQPLCNLDCGKVDSGGARNSSRLFFHTKGCLFGHLIAGQHVCVITQLFLRFHQAGTKYFKGNSQE